MGVTLYCSYYPKECDNKKVIPYLDCLYEDFELNGKHMPEGFYDELGNYAEEVKEFSPSGNSWTDYWIFRDTEKLFKFCENKSCPESLSNHIVHYFEPDHVFIIWKR